MKFDMRIKNTEKNVIQQCVRWVKKCNFSYTNLINIFWVGRMQVGLKDLYTIMIEKDQNTYTISIKMSLFFSFGGVFLL